MTDFSSLRVTESERVEGLEGFLAYARRSSRSLLVLFGGIGGGLGGFSVVVDSLSRPWFIGAALASAACGVGFWLFMRGPYSRGLAAQAAALPWAEGISFISPGSGLVFASRSSLLIERALFRTPALFSHARYSAEMHSIELGEPAPDSDGNYGTVLFKLPLAITPGVGTALAAQFETWWCGRL